jgi:hypothetical protein
VVLAQVLGAGVQLTSKKAANTSKHLEGRRNESALLHFFS